MTQTTARIKQHGKHFEIIVDLDKALKFRKGESSNIDFLEIDRVFTDSKKGLAAPEKELTEAFGTTDLNSVVGKIVKSGEILTTQDYREGEQDKKIKQVVDFLSRNAVDPKTGNPHTAERIKTALEQAQVNIKNAPIESQINDIIEKISAILPVKLETKKIKVIVPAIHTGKAYGILNPYKESENWMNNGDLEATLKIPAGLVMDFYDKLNSATHGSVMSEEVKNGS
ncbi:ribosome assembly factor SBDS [Candidatus Pacearchaeota archaeon]|nr:ribosome assembly factor SBDS [Candidatus Pacearchaeota archaeon]